MYRLIAFDMDGTLLNSEHEISEKTAFMIHKAAEEGKTVIFCTGRAPAELLDYPEQVPDVRYAICASGSILWDTKERKIIRERTLSRGTVLSCLSCAAEFDHTIQIFSENICFPEYTEERLRQTGLDCYSEIYKKIAKTIPDFESVYKADPYPVHKLSIHLTNLQDYASVRKLIEAENLPVALKFANSHSVEITAEGVTKGEALSYLCDSLGIPLSESIAVGDSDNDTDALLAAGLGIAMGNAGESIKKIAGAVVNDNDHEGCADAIEKYLLNR